MSYKKVDALMRHLRDNGIAISGSKQKRQLINTGYFHGYKGYRFFKVAKDRIPYVAYDEIYATIQYDSELKALFYEKMMYIETAVKNIALESILTCANSESLQAMYDKTVAGYNNAPANANNDQRKKFQQNKLNLQKSIQGNLAEAYRKGNPQIVHFYNKKGYSDVPLWALFEILTMGDLGYLLSCLKVDVRDQITQKLSINSAFDTDRVLIYKYIYALKDLRNAIAHNAVVFDTRFRKMDPSKAMQECLKNAVGLPYVNFKTIVDYMVLMCYYLKNLNVPKQEINRFVKSYEKVTREYMKRVNNDIVKMVIHPDWEMQIRILKNYI